MSLWRRFQEWRWRRIRRRGAARWAEREAIRAAADYAARQVLGDLYDEDAEHTEMGKLYRQMWEAEHGGLG